VDDCGGGYSESVAEMCDELQNGSRCGVYVGQVRVWTTVAEVTVSPLLRCVMSYRTALGVV